MTSPCSHESAGQIVGCRSAKANSFRRAKGDNGDTRRGYTLIELAVSLAVASILVAGMGSSVFLASRANNVGLGRYQSTALAGDALAEMTRELAYATAINEAATSNSTLECTVPDVTGDGTLDTLRYSWSGTAGAPLQRKVNNGSPQTVVENVHHLQFTRQKRAKEGGSATESAETTWIDQATAGNAASFDVGSSSGLGLYFAPSLPANATAWRITKVEIRARQHGDTNGVMRVQVRHVTAGLLPAGLIEDVTVSESRLPTSTGPYTIQFPAAASLSPSQGACILFLYESGNGNVARIEYGTNSTSTPNTRKLSTLLGLLWTTQLTEDVRVRIWGTYTGPPGTGTQQFYYTNIDASLQVGTDANQTFHQGIPLLNLPDAGS